MTFKRFLLIDKEKDSDNKTTIPKPKKQKVALFQLGQKVDYAENIMNPITVLSLAGQTGYYMGNTKHNKTQLGQEVKNIEIIQKQTLCLSRIVEPIAKTKDTIASSLSSSWI